MQVLKEKELIQYFRDLFDRGKVFFGASAGSIMLAKQWVRWDNPDDDATASLFPCLGFAPLICDTHAEADDWEELKAELKLDTEGTIVYGIMSGSCLKVFPDGKIEAVAGPINRYTRNSGGIVKLPDLLPEKK